MISGVFVPLLTGFTQSDRVDTGASVEHARWLAEVGVDGLVPFGTSGEGPSLSVREKRATLDALCAAIPGVPIVPAVTEASLDSALQLVEAFNDAPVTALMLLPPYYFRPVADDGLRQFFERVLAVSVHPVLLYHIPEFAPAVPVPIVAELPVWGVKDSGGDVRYTQAVLDAGKRVMVGAEHTIVDAVRYGADGTIAGLANILPEHLGAAVAAARRGDAGTAEEIMAQALKFRQELISAVGPLEWLAVMKLLAQSRHGVDLGGVRAPLPGAPTDAGRLGTRLTEYIGAFHDRHAAP